VFLNYCFADLNHWVRGWGVVMGGGFHGFPYETLLHALPHTIDFVISPRNCFPMQTVFEAISAEP
jgi:hypothetical protein